MKSDISRSFGFAIAGVIYAVKSQRNMKIHCFAALIAVMMGVGTGISSVEWLVLVLTISAVIVAELFNTALEAAIDLVTADYHPLAKTAKDVAAGAVLITAIMSVIIGSFIFLPKAGPLLW